MANASAPIALAPHGRAQSPTGPAEYARPTRYGEGASGAHRTLSASLALVIAGGVGAALMTALVMPDIIEKAHRPLPVGNYPLPTPPEPEPQPPQPDEPQTAQTTIDRPVPRTNIPPTAPQPRPIDDLTSTILPPADPGGAEVIPAQPTPPQPMLPVLRGPVRDARHLRDFQPAYPANLQRDRVEGSCRVEVSITTQGRVAAVRELTCADPAFFATTQRQALRGWRFTPATRDGVAVESTSVQTVVFRLTD
ncbi:MAG: energy transducer TonB [Sphingopyxis sp.]